MAAAEPRKQGPGPDSLIGKPLPEFALSTIEGAELTNASVKGKVVLIDFWASWCGPCKAAAPILQKIHQQYSERGLRVIGANTSERGPEGTPLMTPDIAAAYAKEHGYTYTFTYGSDPFKEACLVTGLPTMLIVDQEGLVRHAVIGLAKDLEANLVQKITPLISE